MTRVHASIAAETLVATSGWTTAMPRAWFAWAAAICHHPATRRRPAVVATAEVVPLLHVLPDAVPGDVAGLELLEPLHCETVVPLDEAQGVGDDLGVLKAEEVPEIADRGGRHWGRHPELDYGGRIVKSWQVLCLPSLQAGPTISGLFDSRQKVWGNLFCLDWHQPPSCRC